MGEYSDTDTLFSVVLTKLYKISVNCILIYRKDWSRNHSMWKHFANFFPVKLVKTAELDPNKGNYLLGSHPHGILCVGAFASVGTDGAGWSKIFPNLIPSMVSLRIFHLAPGWKEINSSLGSSMIMIIILEGSTLLLAYAMLGAAHSWKGTCWPCELAVLA